MQINNLENLNALESTSLLLLKNLKLGALSTKMVSLLIEARTNIAELNGYCIALPNPFLLLSPAILKESLASSEIENIQTTLVKALQNSLFPEAERRDPDKEVLRYQEALIWGFKQISGGLPMVSRLITGIQKELIPTDGSYRTSQNVIWNPTTNEILLVPPKANEITSLIKDWEDFVNIENNLDPLIKNAIAHYQFESIHPFNDGNGRTGRILMVLDLVEKKLLNLPILYLSGYISKNKTQYYKVLQLVRQGNNWEEYLEFMLTAFAKQAKETSKTFLEIMCLLKVQKGVFKKELPKIYSHQLLEELFNSPIVSPVSLSKKLGIHYTTASRYLKEMVKVNLVKTTKVGKHQFYINSELIKILS